MQNVPSADGGHTVVAAEVDWPDVEIKRQTESQVKKSKKIGLNGRYYSTYSNFGMARGNPGYWQLASQVARATRVSSAKSGDIGRMRHRRGSYRARYQPYCSSSVVHSSNTPTSSRLHTLARMPIKRRNIVFVRFSVSHMKYCHSTIPYTNT